LPAVQSTSARHATQTCGVSVRSQRGVGAEQFPSAVHCVFWQVLLAVHVKPLVHCEVSTHWTHVPGWPVTPDGLQCGALALVAQSASVLQLAAPAGTQVCCAEQA
jgi:hypothetical protein